MEAETKIFISHATEDKDEFVRAFAEKLRTKCHVWYDEFSLPFGASIFHSISAGLRDCDFGIVVLSEAFFRKKWTRDEIAGLFALETTEQRRIIPIWKSVTKAQVEQFSPVLAERLAIDASKELSEVIDQVLLAVDESASNGKFCHAAEAKRSPDQLLRELNACLEKHTQERLLNTSRKAPEIVHRAQTELFKDTEAKVKQIALEAPQFRLSCNTGEFRCIPYDIIWLNVELMNGDILRLESTRPSSMIQGLRLDIKVFRPKRDEHGQYTRPDHLEDHRFIPIISSEEVVEWMDGTKTKHSNAAVIDLILTTLHSHLVAILEPTFKSS